MSTHTHTQETSDERAQPRPGMGRRVAWGTRRFGVAALAGAGLLTLVLAGCGSTSTGSAQTLGATTHNVTLTGSATDLQTAVENDIKTVEPSVVQVTSSNCGSGGAQIGSGEILTNDGYIVTNNHVVDSCSSFQVQLASSKQDNATLIGTDPNDDLAILKINESGLHPIAIGDSSKVQVGQFVVAVGSPLGLTESATFGIISATNRTGTEQVGGAQHTLVGLLQTSAPINPGNSGGALVDLSGNLIGIPTLGAVDPNSGGSANGIGFAITSNRMQFIAKQLMQSGQVTNTGQGFLGIQGEDVTSQLAAEYGLPAQSGVLIEGFANDTQGSSPAQQAGIQQGDIITAINGQAVSDSATLSSILDNQQPGSQVTVSVVHTNSNKQDYKVTLGLKPANS